MASEQSPRRRVLGVPGIEHQNPIPQAVEIGGLVFSSAIFGEDPETGEIPDDPARQAELAFGHMRTMLEQAGAGTGARGEADRVPRATTRTALTSTPSG